ncbi:hypothetical protein PROFUN_13558, partial [Planoprotostelium fungivorum]
QTSPFILLNKGSTPPPPMDSGTPHYPSLPLSTYAQMSRRIAIVPQSTYISFATFFFGSPHWTAEFKVISWPAMAYYVQVLIISLTNEPRLFKMSVITIQTYMSLCDSNSNM